MDDAAFVRLMNNTIQESPQFCSKVYTDLWGSSDHFPYYETSDGESIASTYRFNEAALSHTGVRVLPVDSEVVRCRVH